ncbi:C45 family autoproteolytic acyltransferase/hydrolase [Streptomyces sp. NPDC001520]|uniref:C45 family autoproteolytic acyltransferase/hydolase n=1 Tax=Streptomyces sp. NPDC001520 TaxID=3364581 RepID=UPI0036759576
MSATIEEHRLGETSWLVVTGERGSAFRLLGQRESRRIHAVAGESKAIHRLKARVSSTQTAENLAAVREQSRLTYPDQWAELVAMAEGANIPLDNLVLLNLRGDLGTEEKIGCTDLAFRNNDAVFLAHNEDGSPEFEPYCVMLTLRLDGEPAVTTWWYPGFLPSNTITLNEYGLVWGIDNVRVAAPAAAPGRHFVARALQGCRTITEVVDRLRDEPSAGGFAYTIGQLGHPHAIQVEAAAGFYAYRSTRYADDAVLWHTNHLLNLPSSLDVPSDNSLTRAKTAATWTTPHSQPVDWCLQQLARAPIPQGVRRDAAGGDNLVTLVTFVVDLSTATVTVAPRGQVAVTISADDLVHGRPDRQASRPERREELAE